MAFIGANVLFCDLHFRALHSLLAFPFNSIEHSEKVNVTAVGTKA
jgi:hypothetical protein